MFRRIEENMKGRKPIPTKIKLLMGNRGKRPIPMGEAQPDAAIPECPPQLSDAAKAEWFRVVPDLHACGLLTSIDRAALVGYCQAWGLWLEAYTKLQADGAVVKTADGIIMQNPYLRVAKDAMKEVLAFLVEFGMSPSSRARVGAVQANKRDALEEFIKTG